MAPLGASSDTLLSGAEFVPELVHNQSGAGSQVLAVDLNKDGVTDIVTSGELGAFAFLGTRRK